MLINLMQTINDCSSLFPAVKFQQQQLQIMETFARFTIVLSLRCRPLQLDKNCLISHSSFNVQQILVSSSFATIA